MGAAIDWGELRRGAHICHFYRTKQDLLDILVPYFKAGLKTNQLCLWVACDPLSAGEAQAIADSLTRGRQRSMHQFEVLSWDQWYLPGEDVSGLLKKWMAKLKLARAEGFDGLRFGGNNSWLNKETWPAFVDFETLLNRPSVRSQAIVLCSYSLDKHSIAQLVTATSTHQKTVLKSLGKWQIVPRPAQASAYQSAEMSAVLRKARGGPRTEKAGRAAKESVRIPSDLLTVSDAARYLDLSANTVRRWSDGGLLRSYRIGPRKDRRFRQRDLEELLKAISSGKQ